MTMNDDFNIENYSYELPENRIAKHPLPQRDASKLLLWKKGQISHHHFRDCAALIPANSLVVFNDTKVIPARLHFHKQSGAIVEIFLLHPMLPTTDIQKAMTLSETVVWKCLIGNKKKWKQGSVQCAVGKNFLSASYHLREESLIRLEWTSDDSFADVIDQAGKTPLPPYIKRNPVPEDARRYQTVYSENHGAVAAPTAGLHFADKTLQELKNAGIQTEYLTLHVNAATFKPVEVADYRTHNMHCEQIVITTGCMQRLLEYNDRIVAVGTTSLRILETLFWFGNLLDKDPEASFTITRHLPYLLKPTLSYRQALERVLDYCARRKLSELHGETEIYVYPGYLIRSAIGLFTNFHLPKSTLLLLVSAFTNGAWKEIYQQALSHNYRFLSYGDSSLLLR
jgi:S-adenosylmethionine:tRNA ribosyltransferase-isomerase